MDEETFFPSDTDIDFSFTSTTSSVTTATDRTFASSSARTSLARSSLTLSFNESRLSTSTAGATAAANLHHRPHRKSDPHWSAINAATTLSSDGALHLRHLKLLRHLGTGNLGRVFLCRLRDCDAANFALKVVDRDALTNKKLSHVQMEADILSALDHPFLPTLYAHLEVSHYTCLLIDYCPGGDLHSLLRKQPGNRLPVDAAGWPHHVVRLRLVLQGRCGAYTGEPSSDETGSWMFRIAGGGRRGGGGVRGRADGRVFQVLRRNPRIPGAGLVAGTGHGNGVDWWAFGVFIFEMLHGTTPFKGGSKEATLRNIASTRQVKFQARDEEEKGVGITEARDLIERLLVKDPRKRLGFSRGATDIKRHPFFNGIKWPLIRTYTPPEVRGVCEEDQGTRESRDGVPRERGHWWWNSKKNKG
ncbi:Serine/threonine-protein kinase WAG1 [Vitis vinifera]|uniref:non-specific serine/threonine protein kinase n=1 Tax=Vitis vinifera TaxID=29760 RepID=A0A438D0I8_VITVI|nr:Serine/threonine-protein kinase WAG1 [Vitis vinifera]